MPATLFRHASAEEKAFFVVLCELTAAIPTKENIEELYQFIVSLRLLPKKFYVRMDTTKSPFSSYLAYMPRIVSELSIPGVSDCISVDIIVQDTLGVVGFLNKIFALFIHRGVQIKLKVVN